MIGAGVWGLSESEHRREWAWWIDDGTEEARLVAAVATCGDPDKEDRRGRLIVAAPKLLAAAAALYEPDGAPCKRLSGEMFAVLWDAIRKARGDS